MMKVVYTSHKYSHKYVCLFQYLKVNYSTMDSELVQLSENIEEVYNDLTCNTNYSMSRCEFSVLQQRLLSGLLVLSPLRVKIVHEHAFPSFFHEMYLRCPDFSYLPTIYEDYMCVVMPDEKDVLVYMGLSKKLSRLYSGVLPEDGMKEYHQSIINMGKVNRLYRLDLTEPLLGNIISKSKILEIVKQIVGEGSICYKLIKSFLHLPFVDYDNGSYISFGDCIPPTGSLTWVLENLILKEIFDREFAKRFPSIAFSRILNQVIIPNRRIDSYSFDETEIYALINSLSLPGFIQSIRPGDAPITLYKKKTVYLDNEARIIIKDLD
jgi:hypothetical protein